MYLIPNDFLPLIQANQLTQLQTGDTTVVNTIIEMTEAEVRSHLVQKYLIDQELSDTAAWSNSKTYLAGDRVYVTGGSAITIYYGKYPQPIFDLYTQYKVGDLVYYAGHTWKALKASYLPYPDIQYGRYENIPYPNVFPTTANNTYWQDIGAVTITAGTPVTDTSKWTQGDNRNQQLKNYMVDICLYHLHARLAPGNIPALRTERYMGKDTDRSSQHGRIMFPEYCAIGWLQAVGDGRLTAELPRIQPTTSGSRVRWGGFIGTQNNY